MTITITELAELRLRTFLRGTPDYTPSRGVRLAVKDGGCNGYEYDIKIANAPQPDDEIVESGSLKVFIDPKSAPLLDGIVVDYIDSLLESGFKFTNPNATDTCGCGKSFQTAGDCSPAGVPCS
ncbi:HesB/IscA family protein [Nodosilinea sp. PGN35]|uniref:HesB/IscA family protein n=1 Tax=Nodosilinea sp. PGN35 TaxID=3020489 RepID=UPI0023B33C14|nr:iron-sulfur cluster assembly accessory protein [Nodosilinea sp. TSF1-S3]MDF0367151.1 iron-sulfur cluster assembly accessory protein [Nodosilinea sp. TSF1-S3]